MDPRKVSWMRPWTVPNTTVLYTEQELTEEQQAQARKNIGVGEGGGGGVSSWNNLTDKPFGEEVTEGVITFDGNATGKTVAEIDGIPYVKMSDKLLTVDELVGSTIDVVLEFGDENHSGQYVIEEGMVQEDYHNGIHEIQVFQIDAPSVRVLSGDIERYGVTTGDGTYFPAIVESGMVDEGLIFYTRSVSCLTGEVETIKPLDEKYLPDSVKGGGGGTFVLRPTAEELSKVNGGIMCTTNYDEMAKALEGGALVYVLLPESFGSSGMGVKEMILLLTWVYAEEGDTRAIVARFVNFDGVTSNALGRIMFPNGTYVPKM